MKAVFWGRLELGAVVVLTLSLAIGCGSGGGNGGGVVPGEAVTVEVSSSSDTVSVGDERGLQFSAVVKDAFGNVIGGHFFEWSIVGDGQGNLDPASGRYDPPGVLPGDSNVVVVKAVSNKDPGLEGFGSISLLTGPDLTFDPSSPVSGLKGPGVVEPLLSNLSMAVFDKIVYAVWADPVDNQVYFTMRRNTGEPFDMPIRLNNDSSAIAYSPQIAVDTQGNAYVVWYDIRTGTDAGTDFDIYFTKGNLQADRSISFSAPGGGTNPVNLLVNNDADASAEGRDHLLPAIAVDGSGNVYIAWEDPRDHSPNRDIYFAKGIPDQKGNISFAENYPVSKGSLGFDDHGYPSIAVDSEGGIYVAWVAINVNDSNSKILMAKGDDRNSTIVFQDPVSVSAATSQFPFFPDIKVDRNKNIYVTWDEIRGAENEADIILAKSSDAGVSFELLDVAVGPGKQRFSSLAVDRGGNIYIAWEDRRNGDSDIYFAKMMASKPPFSIHAFTVPGVDHYSPSLAIDSAGRAFILWAAEACTPDVSACLSFTMGE